MLSLEGYRCDYCEKVVKRHVTISARAMRYGDADPHRGWGFFEGHRKCHLLDRLKHGRPVKFGTVTRWPA